MNVDDKTLLEFMREQTNFLHKLFHTTRPGTKEAEEGLDILIGKCMVFHLIYCEQENVEQGEKCALNWTEHAIMAMNYKIRNNFTYITANQYKRMKASEQN